MTATDAEFINTASICTSCRHLLVVSVVKGECLLQRSVGAIAARKRLLDRLSTGVASIIALACQYLVSVFAGKDRADMQASRARDVGDDVVELKIYLSQRLLHMLNM